MQPAIAEDGPALTTGRPGQTLTGDKNHGRDDEAALAGAGFTLLRPARNGEAERARGPVRHAAVRLWSDSMGVVVDRR